MSSEAIRSRRGVLSRQAFLRGATLTGLVAATVGATAEKVVAHRPAGPGDQAAAAVPPWPSGELGALTLVWRAGTASRAVALSFDDGPDPRWTPAVLDMLAAAGARATFFCCGAAAARHPELVRKVAAAGEVGNHSWSHPDLAAIGVRRAQAEIDRTHATLTAIVGRAPTLFRPPYGTLSGPVLVAAARHRYRVVLWSDMMQRSGYGQAADVARLLHGLRPGQVLLGHDGRGDRAGVLARLPGLLAGLADAGFEAVTVTELLRRAGGPDAHPPGTAST